MCVVLIITVTLSTQRSLHRAFIIVEAGFNYFTFPMYVCMYVWVCGCVYMGSAQWCFPPLRSSHGASQQKLTQLEQESLKRTQFALALGKPLVISERQSLPGPDTLCCRNFLLCWGLLMCGSVGRGGWAYSPRKSWLLISLSRKEPLKEMSWQFLIEFKQRRGIYYPRNSLTICWYFMWSKVQVMSRGRWCWHLKWWFLFLF